MTDITTRRVTGPAVLPDGSAPASGKITIRLRGWDREAGALVLPFAVTTYIVAGAVDFALWVPALGERYDVDAGESYPALTYDLTIEAGGEQMVRRITVPAGTGDLVFADLLAAGEIVAADAPGALAQCQAFATQAATDSAAALQAAAQAIAAAEAAQTFDPADYQPISAGLTSIAALGAVANRMLYTTGVNSWALATLTAAGRALLDDANAAAQRTTLGLGAMALLDPATEAEAVAGTGTGGMTAELTGAAIAAQAAAAMPYACRAWVSFDGTQASPEILGSGNVSSITDNGTGDYTINFATELPTSDYAASLTAAFSTHRSDIYVLADDTGTPTLKTTTQLRIAVSYGWSATTKSDAACITAALFC